MWAGAAKIGMAQHKTAVRSRGLIKMEEKIALGGGSWGRRGWKRGDEEEKEGGVCFPQGSWERGREVPLQGQSSDK